MALIGLVKGQRNRPYRRDGTYS